MTKHALTIKVTQGEVHERTRLYDDCNWDIATGEGRLSDPRWSTVQIAGEALLEWVKQQVPIDPRTEGMFIDGLIELGNEFRNAADG